MINFPDNPTVGQAFTNAGTIYTCMQVAPIVWNASPAAAGIPDAPVTGLLYGRRDAAWESIDKADIGLGNVDNTSDAAKPISTATATALAGKEPTIAAGTAAQYWRGTKTWATLDKAAVGLGSVDNTPDTVKTVQSALYVRHGASAAGNLMPFSWSDDGTQPTHLWGGTSFNGMVYDRNRVKVGAAALADNSNAVSGISGWNYSNRAKNPTYMWCTDGSAGDQYLTQPGNLSVNYAGTSGYCNGTAENANLLSGMLRADSCYYVGFASADSNQPYMRCSADNVLRYLCRSTNEDRTATGFRVYVGAPYVFEITGVNGSYGITVNPSDIRLKKNIAPSTVEASAAVKQIEFIEHDWKDPAIISHVPLAFSAQNLQSIDQTLVFSVPQDKDSPLGKLADSDEILHPQVTMLVAYLAKALQETMARVAALEAK